MSRLEKDSMGEIYVPKDRYWGAQTQRSLENFIIGDQRFSRPMIWAMGTVKKAAAMANEKLGILSKDFSAYIQKAADEVIVGKLDDHFPLVIWQTGSGTQSNMNANEVIANRAIEMMGGVLGSKVPIHPNDHVNLSQSSNDAFPTFMHVAVVREVSQKLLPEVVSLRKIFEEKAEYHKEVIKIGRTHLMDATPMTLGQELKAFASLLAYGEQRLKDALVPLYEIALGGTAVGTGLNSPMGYDKAVSACLADITNYPFISAPDKFAALSAHDSLVNMSSALRLLATEAFKIANDIRLLSSGPRCGLGEYLLPSNEPGSSIMPGKVNPTQCEALTMVAAYVMGLDVSVGFAGSQGHFQLNVFKPMIIHAILQSIDLLSSALLSFKKNAIFGLKFQEDKMRENANRSLMLAAALNPVIGYDRAAQVAKKAYEENTTLKEAAIALKFVTAEEFDKNVQAGDMIKPYKITSPA